MHNSLWNKGRTSIQGKPCMRALRGEQPGQLIVRAVLRHFVPNKGVPPLRCLRHLSQRTLQREQSAFSRQSPPQSLKIPYSFFYSGDNDYRNSVVSFCNTALLLISDFFSAPLANQKESQYNMTGRTKLVIFKEARAWLLPITRLSSSARRC